MYHILTENIYESVLDQFRELPKNSNCSGTEIFLYLKRTVLRFKIKSPYIIPMFFQIPLYAFVTLCLCA